MKDDIRNFKTWAGVNEDFKATHRDKNTGELRPRVEWEITPTQQQDDCAAEIREDCDPEGIRTLDTSNVAK